MSDEWSEAEKSESAQSGEGVAEAADAPAAVPAARRLPMHSVLFRIVVSGGLLLLSMAIVAGLMATREEPPKDDGRLLPRVPVINVRRVEVPRQWVGFGVATAEQMSVVPARVSAAVASVPPTTKEGLRVTEGQILVQLDPEDFRRQREMADEALKSLDAQLTALSVQEEALREQVRLAEQDAAIAAEDVVRFERAYADGAARIREVDAAKTRHIQTERQAVSLREQLSSVGPKRLQLEAQAASQRAAHEQANTNEERCTVRSPITGFLQSFDLHPGESVAVGQAVARVVDPSVVEVELRLPAQSRSTIVPGDRALVSDGGLGGNEVIGRVDRVAPEDDPQTRTLSAYIEFDGDDAKRVPPGSIVEVVVESGNAGRSTIVPRRAIRGDRLHVVEGGAVRAVPVTRAFPYRGRVEGSGLDDVAWVVLEDDLPESTVIVLDASRRVGEPGSTIEPVTQGAP